jgi:hypothetical protein
MLLLKRIAMIGLAAAFALSSSAAFAVDGNSSAYGTDGYAPTVPTHHSNEGKERAEAGANWIRHHHDIDPQWQRQAL